MSFLDNLRAMVGLKPKDAEPKKPKVHASPDAFKALCDQYTACQDAKEKGEIMGQIQQMLPHILFLATMCYEGENASNTVSGKDRDLHATVGAKRLYAVNQASVTHGNPGYRIARKNDKRRMHLHTLVNNKTKQVWVPLFTDFTKLLPVFGQNYRVTLISFDEARDMAKGCTGIVINPSKDGSIYIGKDQMKHIG